MASWVSPVIAVLLIVVTSSSGAVSGCVIKCFIDREAEQDEVCAIRCNSSASPGSEVWINREVLRTALDCDSHSLETNPHCLWRENNISVGAKIKSDSGTTHFEYKLTITSCRGWNCEFRVEFNGPTCSVVSEDLSKPCIENPMATSEDPMATSADPMATSADPMATSADPVATSTHPTATSPEPTTTTESGPTEPTSVTPDNGIIGAVPVVIVIIIAAVVIASIAVCCYCRQRQTSRNDQDEVPDGVTEKSPLVKKRQ